MANFRRKKPALYTSGKRFNKWKGKEMEKRGIHYYWLDNWPSAWDLVYHRRPPRRRTKALEGVVMRGDRDPDDIAWPLAKKPHLYYW